MQKSIYLCGPITGESYEEANKWREDIKRTLDPKITVYSPMRHKDYLKEETDIAKSYDKFIMSTQKAITTRDRMDVFNVDLMISNLLGAKRVSIGSMIEYGWADAKRIPIITVMEEGNIHHHPMLKEISSWIVSDLDEASYIANCVLTPDKNTGV